MVLRGSVCKGKFVGVTGSAALLDDEAGEVHGEDFAVANRSTGIVNQEQSIYDQPTGNTVSDMLSLVNSNSHFQFHAIHWNLSYRKTFKQENKELDIYYEGSN